MDLEKAIDPTSRPVMDTIGFVVEVEIVVEERHGICIGDRSVYVHVRFVDGENAIHYYCHDAVVSKYSGKVCSRSCSNSEPRTLP